MIYVVREISTVEGTELTYFYVEMWRNRGLFVAGFDPDLEDEIMIQLITEEDVIVENEAGHWKTTAGDFIDPDIPRDRRVHEPDWEREAVEVDVVPIISEKIFGYWNRARARGDAGNHSSRPDRVHPGTRGGKPVKRNETPGTQIKRDLSDPKGVLSTPDVQVLLDTPVEVR